MAAVTQQIAQQHLELWLAADAAVASNQSYSIGGRTLTRADAKEIRANIDYWEARVNRKGSGARVRYGVMDP